MVGISLAPAAPIVRNAPDGRELVMARWGMPSPAFALKGRKVDPGVTVHPKAMPVILRTETEREQWLTAPTAEAMELQRPLPYDALTIVARGSKQDGAGGPP